MDTTALQTAMDALAANINRQAVAGTLPLDGATRLLNAAADFLRAAKPTRLYAQTLTSPAPLANFTLDGFINRSVQLVVVHVGTVSRVLPAADWSWNLGLGKLTLLNSYTFPTGCTVDLYFTE